MRSNANGLTHAPERREARQRARGSTMAANAELCLSQLRRCGRAVGGGPIAIDNFTVSFGEGRLSISNIPPRVKHLYMIARPLIMSRSIVILSIASLLREK